MVGQKILQLLLNTAQQLLQNKQKTKRTHLPKEPVIPIVYKHSKTNKGPEEILAPHDPCNMSQNSKKKKAT